MMVVNFYGGQESDCCNGDGWIGDCVEPNDTNGYNGDGGMEIVMMVVMTPLERFELVLVMTEIVW